MMAIDILEAPKLPSIKYRLIRFAPLTRPPGKTSDAYAISIQQYYSTVSIVEEIKQNESVLKKMCSTKKHASRLHPKPARIRMLSSTKYETPLQMTTSSQSTPHLTPVLSPSPPPPTPGLVALPLRLSTPLTSWTSVPVGKTSLLPPTSSPKIASPWHPPQPSPRQQPLSLTSANLVWFWAGWRSPGRGRLGFRFRRIYRRIFSTSMCGRGGGDDTE